MPTDRKSFTDDPRVLACVNKLKAKFTDANPLIVSDVTDEQDNQYAHLVQKGGGVLGVALIGYTYILELMGIRFLKQAGTSAGAINTALMSVIGKKEDAKSLPILDAVCELDFFALVDGHKTAKRIIRQVITDGDYVKRIKTYVIGYFATMIFLLLADVLLLGLLHKYEWLIIITGISFMLTGLCVVLAVKIISSWLVLMRRLKNAGYGVNPGDYFYDWIKNQFERNGVKTIRDLDSKAEAPIPGLKLRHPHPRNLDGLEGSVAFISSELSSKNKIQLPQMWNLFRTKETVDTLHPAGFVRASMSIPIFFESYIIDDIECSNPQIKKAWMDRFGESNPPSCARFVDGGMLSNFPLDLFYNANVEVPRLPVFGIDLDSALPGDNTMTPLAWSLGGYFGRMFSTLQNHSDKEFLLKNKVYKKGVGSIKVQGYNWLNFFMDTPKKVELFVLGVEAATDFLLNFEWESYKKERSQMQTNLQN